MLGRTVEPADLAAPAFRCERLSKSETIEAARLTRYFIRCAPPLFTLLASLNYIPRTIGQNKNPMQACAELAENMARTGAAASGSSLPSLPRPGPLPSLSLPSLPRPGPVASETLLRVRDRCVRCLPSGDGRLIAAQQAWLRSEERRALASHATCAIHHNLCLSRRLMVLRQFHSHAGHRTDRLAPKRLVFLRWQRRAARGWVRQHLLADRLDDRRAKLLTRGWQRWCSWDTVAASIDACRLALKRWCMRGVSRAWEKWRHAGAKRGRLRRTLRRWWSSQLAAAWGRWCEMHVSRRSGARELARTAARRWRLRGAAAAFYHIASSAALTRKMRGVAKRWLRRGLAAAWRSWAGVAAAAAAARAKLRAAAQRWLQRHVRAGWVRLRSHCDAQREALLLTRRTLGQWRQRKLSARLLRWWHNANRTLSTRAALATAVARWCSQWLSRGFGAWAARALARAARRRAQAVVLRWLSGKLAVAWGTWVDTYQRSPKLPLSPKQATARWRRRTLTRALRRLHLKARRLLALDAAAHRWRGAARVAAWRVWSAESKRRAKLWRAWEGARAAVDAAARRRGWGAWRVFLGAEARRAKLRRMMRTWKNSAAAAAWRKWRGLAKAWRVAARALERWTRRDLRLAVAWWAPRARCFLAAELAASTIVPARRREKLGGAWGAWREDRRRARLFLFARRHHGCWFDVAVRRSHSATRLDERHVARRLRHGVTQWRRRAGHLRRTASAWSWARYARIGGALGQWMAWARAGGGHAAARRQHLATTHAARLNVRKWRRATRRCERAAWVVRWLAHRKRARALGHGFGAFAEVAKGARMARRQQAALTDHARRAATGRPRSPTPRSSRASSPPPPSSSVSPPRPEPWRGAWRPPRDFASALRSPPPMGAGSAAFNGWGAAFGPSAVLPPAPPSLSIPSPMQSPSPRLRSSTAPPTPLSAASAVTSSSDAMSPRQPGLFARERATPPVRTSTSRTSSPPPSPSPRRPDRSSLLYSSGGGDGRSKPRALARATREKPWRTGTDDASAAPRRPRAAPLATSSPKAKSSPKSSEAASPGGSRVKSYAYWQAASLVLEM